MTGWFQRITGAIWPSTKTTPEGAFHPGPYYIHDRGWLPDSWGQYANFWQMNYDPIGGRGMSAMVEACVSAYAQTIAMCPGTHWRELSNGGREKVTTSALSRILRVPNDYQTRSDFLMNLVRALYLEGNAYALALRNDRFEISSLHLMNPFQCLARTIEGEVFYDLSGNYVIEDRLKQLDLTLESLRAVPARDVLHVKLHTIHSNPLHGETPLSAAALAIAASNIMMRNSLKLFGSQLRPSGVLQTEKVLTKSQVEDLRKLWNDQAKNLAEGGVPILTNDLKFQPISATNRDSQFADAMKLTDQQIAEVFRVPLAIVGISGQPQANTEALMNLWIMTGLGFAIDHVELAFDQTFGLSKANGEYTEFDTNVLLRSAFKDRMEGLTRAVQGGIYAPDEARAMESLAAAPKGAGKEPRVQQQVVPLSFATEPPTPPTPPAPTPPPEDTPSPEDQAAGLSFSDWNRWFDDEAA